MLTCDRGGRGGIPIRIISLGEENVSPSGRCICRGGSQGVTIRCARALPCPSHEEFLDCVMANLYLFVKYGCGLMPVNALSCIYVQENDEDMMPKLGVNKHSTQSSTALAPSSSIQTPTTRI